jgi:hypothetical protein
MVRDDKRGTLTNWTERVRVDDVGVVCESNKKRSATKGQSACKVVFVVCIEVLGMVAKRRVVGPTKTAQTASHQRTQ